MCQLRCSFNLPFANAFLIYVALKCQRVLTYFICHYPRCLTNSKGALQLVTPIHLIVIRVFGICISIVVTVLCRRNHARMLFCLHTSVIVCFNLIGFVVSRKVNINVEYNVYTSHYCREQIFWGWYNCNTSGHP